MSTPRWAIALLPCLLAGCLQQALPTVKPVSTHAVVSGAGGSLLPQPDTPPVSPLTPRAGVVPTSASAGGSLLPQPDTPPVSTGLSSNASAGATIAPAIAPAVADAGASAAPAATAAPGATAARKSG